MPGTSQAETSQTWSGQCRSPELSRWNAVLWPGGWLPRPFLESFFGRGREAGKGPRLLPAGGGTSEGLSCRASRVGGLSRRHWELLRDAARRRPKASSTFEPVPRATSEFLLFLDLGR